MLQWRKCVKKWGRGCHASSRESREKGREWAGAGGYPLARRQREVLAYIIGRALSARMRAGLVYPGAHDQPSAARGARRDLRAAAASARHLVLHLEHRDGQGHPAPLASRIARYHHRLRRPGGLVRHGRLPRRIPDGRLCRARRGRGGRAKAHRTAVCGRLCQGAGG